MPCATGKRTVLGLRCVKVFKQSRQHIETGGQKGRESFSREILGKLDAVSFEKDSRPSPCAMQAKPVLYSSRIHVAGLASMESLTTIATGFVSHDGARIGSVGVFRDGSRIRCRILQAALYGLSAYLQAWLCGSARSSLRDRSPLAR